MSNFRKWPQAKANPHCKFVNTGYSADRCLGSGTILHQPVHWINIAIMEVM